MNHIANEPLPAVIVIVLLDGIAPVILEDIICNGEIASLIDIDDHHHFCVNADRITAVAI